MAVQTLFETEAEEKLPAAEAEEPLAEAETGEAAEITETEKADGARESAAEAAEEEATDYARLAAEDLLALKAQFPALRSLTSLLELPDAVRYAELRELGLSPREAYLATGGTPRQRADNRSHLLSAVPRRSALGTELPTSEEMAEARRLFADLTDAQIHRLYKKVMN